MVTMQQVADRAGVSISTVSFVVNGTKPVTTETRERIQRAIDDLGYRRNALARALASRRSHVIAMIHPIIDRNHYGFVEAAAGAAAAAGYNLVLWPVHSDDEAREITSLTTTGAAGGVLLLEVQYDDARVRALQEANSPFVLIGRTGALEGMDFVDIDFESTVANAIDLLANEGHRHIGLVVEDFSATALASYAPPLRAADIFRAEMSRRDLHGAVFTVPRVLDPEAPAETPGAGVVARIAATAPETTALIVMHATASFAIVRDLRARGFVIPRDMSVVGIAVETAVTSLVDPPLTTFETPSREMGRLATEVLIARMAGAEPGRVHRLIGCEMRPGASVAPAPRGRRRLDAG